MRALGLPPPPWIVGHRGVRGVGPENTVDSVREAVAQKADMVELDLQRTGDNELVVFHDLAIRVSEEQRRPIGELTLEEIKRCRPVWRRRRGLGRAYEVSTLSEVLAIAPVDLPLNLEIKHYDPQADPAPLVEALAKAIAGRDRILVSSFHRPVLAAVRRSLPAVLLAPIGGLLARWDDLLEAARRLDAFSIHLHRRLAASLGQQGTLDEPGARDRPILAYTVNEAAEARQLIGCGVSGFFTDRPAELRGRLGRAGRARA